MCYQCDYINDMQAQHDKATDRAHRVIGEYLSGLLFVDELVDAIRRIELPPHTPGVVDKTCGLRCQTLEERAERHAEWKSAQRG